MSLTYEITRLIHTMPGMDINQNGHDTMKSLAQFSNANPNARNQRFQSPFWCVGWYN